MQRPRWRVLFQHSRDRAMALTLLTALMMGATGCGPAGRSDNNASAADDGKVPTREQPASAAEPVASQGRAAPADATSAMSERAAATLDQDFRSAIDARIALLRSRNDPRSQFDLALLLPLANDSDLDDGTIARRHALAQARGLAQLEGVVAWLEAMLCQEAADCDSMEAIKRLQQIEPDNAAVWLLELEHIDAQSDDKHQ
ncbi:MAG: hypothetical protein ACREP7_05410, partial [Lysobacter sp.]